MMEPEKRGWAAFDRTLGVSAGAVLGVLAGLHLGPDAGNVVSASAGSLMEELIHGLRQLTLRRMARAEMAAEEAAGEARCEFAELVRRSLEDDRRTLLMSAALQAAADAADEVKVKALGRAYARGTLASDDAKVDEQLRIVTTLAAMEPADIRVAHTMTSASTWSIRPMQQNKYYPSIVAECPGVAPIVDAVVARLSTYGVITNDATGGLDWSGSGSQWHLTSFGELCLTALREVGLGAKPYDE